MANVIWYICLAVFGLGITVYVIYIKRDTYEISTLIVFYLFSSAITWFGEFIVLGLFNSYEYKTGVFQDPWAQNLFGHLLLNASMYPAPAIVMVAYSLGYGMIASTALIFVFLEYIFIKNGLYEHHWWRYYMSAINVVLFLQITKKWFLKMNQNRHGSYRTITFYFVAFLIIHLPTPILLLLGKLHYQLDFVNKIFHNFYLSSTIVAFSHHIFISFVIVFFVCVLKKWYWKIVPFIVSITILTIYTKINVLIIDDGWKLIYYLIIQQICIAIFILIENYTLKPNNNSLERNE